MSSIFLRPGRFAFLLICFVLLSAVNAAASPLLWKVDDPESGGRLYLFGSIHFGSEALYPLPEYVTDAYADSDTLAVELDLSAIDASEAARVLMAVGRLPEGDSIRQHVSPEVWPRLVQAAERSGLPLSAIERLQPWLLAVQLTAAEVRRKGFSEGFGVDRHFLTLAKHPLAPKPIFELETFEQQMSLFGGLGRQQQGVFLEQTLNEMESAEDLLGEIIKSWREGDESSLAELVVGSFQEEGAAELFQRIFVQRNALMEAKLLARLQQGQRLFVVVGAGHVVGDDGLKQRFSDLGYPVARIGPEQR